MSLPEGDLSGPQTVRYWATDRAALADCGSKQKALSSAVDVLEKEVQ